MKNIGFAQRVMVSSFKIEKADNNFHSQKQKEVQAEINQNKVNIDRACFSKTNKEKEEVRQAKKDWKREQLQENDSFFKLENI